MGKGVKDIYLGGFRGFYMVFDSFGFVNFVRYFFVVFDGFW